MREASSLAIIKRAEKMLETNRHRLPKSVALNQEMKLKGARRYWEYEQWDEATGRALQAMGSIYCRRSPAISP